MANVCMKHTKVLAASKLPPDLLNARLMSAFSQDKRVLHALHFDPFISELAHFARFLGIVEGRNCICCHLGDEAVKNLADGVEEPVSASRIKETVV